VTGGAGGVWAAACAGGRAAASRTKVRREIMAA